MMAEGNVENATPSTPQTKPTHHRGIAPESGTLLQPPPLLFVIPERQAVDYIASWLWSIRERCGHA